MGFIQTSPYTYYWHTDGVAVGFQTIKAIYTNSDNQTISDERSIKILPVSASCPEDVMDIDGNIYPVVQIGNQCWMQANLKTTNYPDGEPLINGIDSLVGGLPNELPGWYFAYNKDSNYIHSYGYLYTWVTAMKGNTAAAENTRPIQGICPDGWHVPNADEWRVLIDFLGGLEMAGDRLKDPNVNTWTDSLSDLTSNGFNALPGGCRVSDGSYIEESNSAYFWTATETIPNHAYHILLNNNNSKAAILGHQDSKRFGYSVRCVKD
ncbi:MAG: FISUMP domain-containing protein [Bacteroidales bacterium]|nr:FISUMP domain-containing protein [Bacteroidales bacterium]